MIKHCKSCGQRIIWMKTSNNKFMPVDLFNESGKQVDDTAMLFDPRIMISHFASCSHAAQHRKKKEGK